MRPLKNGNLPIEGEELIPHRPPMLLVKRLLERDRQAETALVEAEAPTDGILVDSGSRLIPEYSIELGAQAAALANGYDRLMDGAPDLQGFLSGLGDLRWLQDIPPGEKLYVNLHKEFEFANVKMFAASVANRSGLTFFQGTIKVWEQNE